MEICEGKRYWTRGGGISPLIERHTGTSALGPYWGDAELWWYQDGRYLFGQISAMDLVAEYAGPELIPVPIPEVGKRYVTTWNWVTAPVANVEGNLITVGSPGNNKTLLVTTLKREYQGANDPINTIGRRLPHDFDKETA